MIADAVSMHIAKQANGPMARAEALVHSYMNNTKYSSLLSSHIFSDTSVLL
jgi:hypothetical protein